MRQPDLEILEAIVERGAPSATAIATAYLAVRPWPSGREGPR
jgi:hypothetical protein